MNKALKVVMIIFGMVLILEGLLDIIIPSQRASLIASGGSAGSAVFFMMILGATWVAAGFWVVASGRDPLRHLNWVKFVMTLPVLLSAVLTLSIIRGYVSLDQVVVDLALDAVFAVTFMALYPWRKVSGAGNKLDDVQRRGGPQHFPSPSVSLYISRLPSEEMSQGPQRRIS